MILDTGYLMLDNLTGIQHQVSSIKHPVSSIQNESTSIPALRKIFGIITFMN